MGSKKPCQELNLVPQELSYEHCAFEALLTLVCFQIGIILACLDYMINYDAKEAESIVVEFIFASMDYVIDFEP